jgi:hypothetical protein
MKTAIFSPERAAFAVFGLLAIVPVAARAEGDAKNAPKKTSEKDYVLVHQSSYSSPSTPRNPFWPIGWTPSAPQAAPEAVVAAPTVRAEDFSVSSVSMDYPPLAVINKRTYGVGDRITLAGAAPGGEFVTVKQITDGVVVLDHRGTLLRCPTSHTASGKK